MLFTCKQSEIVGYLSLLARVIDANPSMPVLSNVLLEATDKGVTMTTSNLELTMKVSVKADVEEGGKVTVPAKAFAELVSSLPDEPIKVKMEGNLVYVRTSNTTTQFNTINPSDFPSLPSIGESKILSFKSSELKQILHLIVFAAATDDSKPVFSSVYFDGTSTNISLVASDGYRLSKYTINKTIPEEVKWLVPIRTMKELARSLKDNDDKVNFSLSKDKKHVIIEHNNVQIFTRLIDGEYPDYAQVIPSTSQIKAKIASEDLRSALRRVNVFVRNAPGNKLQLTFKPDDGSLVVEGTLAEVGSNKTVIPAQIDGVEFTVTFGARFLTELVNNIGSGTIIFEGDTPSNPSIFKIDDNSHYLHLVMPMVTE